MKKVSKILLAAAAGLSILAVTGCYTRANERTMEVEKVEQIHETPHHHHHVIEKIKTEHVHK